MKNIIDWFRSLGFPGLRFWVPVLVWAGLTLWVSFFGDDRFFSPTAFQLWEGVWWGALTHAFWSPSLLSAGMQILAFAIFIWVLDRPLQRVLTSLVYAVTMAYALVVLMAPFLLQFLGATTVLGFLWLRILLKEPSLVRGQGLGKWSAVLAGWLLFSAEMELRGHLFGPDSLWSLAMAMGLILGMCTALFLRISTWLWRTQNRPIPLGVLWGVSLSSLAFWVVLTLEPRTDYGMMWRFDRGDRSEPVMQWVEAVLKNPTSGFRDQLVQRSLFDNNVPGLSQSKVLDSVLKRLDSVDVSLKSSVLLGEVPGTQPQYIKLMAWLDSRSQSGFDLMDDNLRAMIYCGSRDSSFLNPIKGAELARQLNARTRWSDASLLDTYASCLVRLGQRQEAIFWMDRALVVLERQPAIGLWELARTQEAIISNRQKLITGQMIEYPAGPL